MSKIESINELLAQVFESLDSYSKIIPYDAIVLGKNDRVVTISSGKEFDFYKGRSVSFIGDLKRKITLFINLSWNMISKNFAMVLFCKVTSECPLVELNENEPSCELVIKKHVCKKREVFR